MTTETILPPDLEAAIAREAGEFYAFDDGTAREAFQRIARLAWEARGAADTGTCTWTVDDDIDRGPIWETQCGDAFVFNDGGPADNGAAYCFRCGRRLVESRPSDEPAQEPGAAK